MKRRRDYYSQHPGAETLPPSEDRGVEFHDRIIYTEDEKISLSLELCAEGIPFKTPSAIHGHNGPDNIKISDVRYLVCPAAFSVGNLKKFIRMKFDLKPKYEIDIFQTAEPLADFYTLMDIAYIYTWTRRAPLRLYYTVYERLTAPKTHAVAVDRHSTTVLEETSTVSNNEKDDENHGLKRKHDDGPDDVSFDLSAETPEKGEEAKKDTANQKKKNKKQVDSTVLEAVSKSEEILAKLSLNCSNDGDAALRNGDKEVVSVANEGIVNKENAEKMFNRTPTKINTKTILKDDSPVSLSMFEPLNGVSDSVNVYDFQAQEPSSSGEFNKPKVKRGRKKKAVTERDKTVNSRSYSDQTDQGDTNLVMSSKHPVIKAATPTKGRLKRMNVSSEDSKQPVKKIKKTIKDTSKVNCKRKTVKEILEHAQGNEQVEKIPKKRGRKPGSVNKVKRAKTAGNDKDKIISSSENVPQSKESAIDSETRSVERVNSTVFAGENRSDNSISSDLSNVSTDKVDPSFNETVSPNYCINEDPVTPPYGETPKPSELNPGLPVSVNGNMMRESNGAINNNMSDGIMNGMNGMCALDGPGFRQMMNGYIPAVDSDQPLDLTNNAQRSEYTKGKIFKTKLLKKTLSKQDSLTESGDRTIQNGHNSVQPMVDDQL